ncbi:MAG TPA: LuxR C-terminal-related transcriptional regulator [Chthoniobacterales bacterium]|nr:LuxR C-terminal-related transcriptional regulator [Chthoniobacterales bacterium]
MGHRLTQRQLQALSDSIRMLYQSGELDDFPRQVFAAIGPLVRCDYFSYNEFARDGALRVVHCEPGLPASAMEFLLDIGPEFSKEHPSVSHITRTGAPQPFKITDFGTQRQWRQTRLYNEFYKPLECEYQMAFASPLPDGQVALAFNCTRRDYTEDDRQLLELLRPHLMQAHANAQMFTRVTTVLHGKGGAFLSAAADGSIAYATGHALRSLERYFGPPARAAMLPPRLRDWLIKSAVQGLTAGPLEIDRDAARLRVTLVSRERDGTCNLLLEEQEDSVAAKRLIALGLTPREAEVLIWGARGKATAEIAVILKAKPATISKHLDHIYQKLGVDNRTSAAAYVTGA